MKEEHVTKALLSWLIKNGWEIVCFDFPQSGTGHFLHPNDAESEKNKGAINPDIVAVKGDVCLFFENKDRFYYPDYEKQHALITGNDYSIAIGKLLSSFTISKINYGIGLPTSKHAKKSQEAAYLVDFIVGVEEDKSISVLYNPAKISFT